MTRRRGPKSPLWWAVAACALVAGPAPAAAAEAPARNVVLVVVDDLGWRDLGCQGSDYYRTPHIDRLAASGARFTDAYAACPVCSPSRAAILTGKYPARILLTDWLPSGRWNPHARLRPGRFVRDLPLEETTLAEAFRAAGRTTALIGKWHLGGPPFSLPEHHGFDLAIGGNAHGAPGSYFHPYAGNWKIPTTGARATWNVLDDGQPGEYLTDRLAAEAERFIRRPHDKPFFLYLPHYGVHTPLEAKPGTTAPYEAVPEDRRQGKPAYAAMIASVDDAVGRVLTALDETGLADDTVVILTSDNGGFAGATSNAPLRANKGSCYEGGIRVPLLIRWPGVTRPGTVVTAPVTGTDLYPTCLAAAGLPPEPHQHLDGVNLEPLLRGGAAPERTALYWHFPHYSEHPASAPGSVIRKGAWKLIESFDPEARELYDLAADVGETRDLAGERPEIVAELSRDLAAWRRDVGAEMMRPNPDHDPARAGGGRRKKGAKRPNVLFISIDDLRPALGCYGDRQAKTPAIDRLAAGGRQFLAAYCQQAVCGPSRTSLLTGRLPDNVGVWHNRHRFRDRHPDLVTLPQLFKQAGYHTQALGKVFSGDEREDDPASWSVPTVLSAPGWRNYAGDAGRDGGKGVPAEAGDVDDEGYPDGKLASLAIETLGAMGDRPFFLAVGFFKPHLPFNAPRRYWDLHDPAAFAADPEPRTADAPDAAYPDHRELAGYAGVPDDERPAPAEARRLRQGYYACVSYVDAQVGRLLEALERLGLADDTIVVLWGDHGYSLGEADHWCKATNFERDTRVPLVIRVPGMRAAGVPTAALVEHVDLYPTVAALAGLAAPGALDGTSLVPILDDPAAPGRAFALSRFVRPWKARDPDVTGYSLRGPTHRYTRWIDRAEGRVVAEELYDYGRLPTAGDGAVPFVERVNVVAEAGQEQALARHRAALDESLATRIDGAGAAAPAAGAATPPAPLFRQGEGGVHTYRIPGVAVTARGTVLAWCEARRFSAADRGEIEIHLRRSTDGGRTWEAPRQVAHLGPRLPRNPHMPAAKKRKNLGGPDEQTVNNAVAIATRAGAVHLLYCVEYMRCFHIRSDDDGRTWSAPREITAAADGYRPRIDWQGVAFGPGHGIELAGGRLVAPLWIADYRPAGEATAAPRHGSGVIVSDDGGDSWRAGDLALAAGGEACVAELPDGRVLLTARNGFPRERRLAATSADGATGWSEPRFIDDLPEWGCMAGMTSHPGTPVAPGPLLLHVAIDTDSRAHTARRDLTVWASRDGGETWPVKRLLRAGPSAYADLAVLPDGRVICVYESGLDGVGPGDGKTRPWAYACVAATTFDLEWLLAPGG